MNLPKTLALAALGLSLSAWPTPRTLGEEHHSHHSPAHEAELTLLEVTTDALAEQYRHLLMETFKARIESKMKRLEHEVSGGAELNPDATRRMLALEEARIRILEETTERVRRQFIELRIELASNHEGAEETDEAEHEHEHAASGLNGRWIGHEVGDNTRLRMTVEGDHARFEAPDQDFWYEGEFEIGEQTNGLRVVDFHILKCAQPDYNRKTSLGLARLEENRFVLAANEPGRESRPTSLEPDGETKVFVFERE